VGVTLPQFELTDKNNMQGKIIRLANHTDKDFNGTLKLVTPSRFKITPAEHRVNLTEGQTVELAVKAEIVSKGKRGTFPVQTLLLRSNGETEWKGQLQIEYLGQIERTVCKAVEDAWVTKNVPSKSNSDSSILNIDGGNKTAGDEHHAVAYIKFKPAFSGKPILATLRIINAGNPTGNSGEIHLLNKDWSEKELNYDNRPEPDRVLAKIGPVKENEKLEFKLPLTPDELSRKTLSLAIVPTSNDGVNYISREGGQPAELIIEYRPEEKNNH
jgi:hypothetical protein